MSVLIKGMDMPTECNKCQLLFGDVNDGFCHGANKWLDSEDFVWEMIDEEVLSDKPINCPLVEVPTPHSRLIDEEEIDKALSAYTVVELSQSEWKDIYDAINSVPTVIEAEE